MGATQPGKRETTWSGRKETVLFKPLEGESGHSHWTCARKNPGFLLISRAKNLLACQFLISYNNETWNDHQLPAEKE
jgi:hypothetical protein